MPSFRELMFINDPMPMTLGEKVRPKEAEPAPCPYAAFQTGDHLFGAGDSVPAFSLECHKELNRQHPPAPSRPVADPDGWTPHDGGPCPVPPGVPVVILTSANQKIPFHEAQSISQASWRWVKAYKIATPPEAPKQPDPATPHKLLAVQQERQRAGLPVEWDKVPVGSKVWVRDHDFNAWRLREFSGSFRFSFMASAGAGYSPIHWNQCKLFIEGVAP